jgi:chorismate synthase
MSKNEVVLEALSLIDAGETHGMNIEQIVEFITKGQKFTQNDKREIIEALHAFYPAESPAEAH